MRNIIFLVLCASFLLFSNGTATAEPALKVLGGDYTFPNKAKVAAEITDSIVRNTGTDPSYIYVIFEDVKHTDWAGGGNLYGETG